MRNHIGTWNEFMLTHAPNNVPADANGVRVCVCVLWRSTFQRKWLATTTMNLHDSQFWLKHDADCITGLMLWLIVIIAGIVTIRRFVAKCEKIKLDSLTAMPSVRLHHHRRNFLESLTHHVIDVWFVCTLSLFWFVRNCRRSWHVRRVRTDPTVTYNIIGDRQIFIDQ